MPHSQGLSNNPYPEPNHLNSSYFFKINSNIVLCRPRWSRGKVLASRSNVPGLNPDAVDEFFQDVKILSTSPPGGTLRWGSRV